MKLGTEIKRARLGLGLTQAAYGERVGLTQQRVNELERGASVGMKTVERLVARGGLKWTEKGPQAA